MGPKKDVKDEIEDVVKRVVQQTLQDTTMLATFANLIQESVTAAVAELSTALEESRGLVNELKLALDDRDKKIRHLECRLDDMEQYQRRQCLRIFGVPEVENEDTDVIAIQVAEKTGVSLQVSDIDRSHRVGKKTDDRPRAIIVKFVSYRKRSEVFRNKRLLKGSQITVREDLTSTRHKLLREAISKYGVTNVWTLDGSIIVKEGNVKRRLSNVMELGS